MRFDGSGKYEQGVADVDPVATPGTILQDHIFNLPDRPEDTEALYLALVGTGGETLTLDLYFLLDETNAGDPVSRFIDSSHRWFQFATGIVVTNGTLQKITASLPGGGVIYGRRTADTITAGQTRVLKSAWKV